MAKKIKIKDKKKNKTLIEIDGREIYIISKTDIMSDERIQELAERMKNHG